MTSLVLFIVGGVVLGGILGWLLGRGRPAPQRTDRAPPAAGPAPAGPAPLHDPAQILWGLIRQGRLLVVPRELLDHPEKQVYLALLVAAHEHWHPDGTRSPCELGLEQLQERWPQTIHRQQKGSLGISDRWLEISAQELQRKDRLVFCRVSAGRLNVRGIGFRSVVLPGEAPNGQQGTLFPDPPTLGPEDLVSATGPNSRSPVRSRPNSRSPVRSRPNTGSGDPNPPQTPPVRSGSVSLEKDLLTPTSPPRDPPTAAPAPGPASAAVPPTPTANTAPPSSPGPKGGGSVVALRPKGTCFQCLSGYSLPESPAEKTEPRRVPAMGLIGVLPETLRAVPITSELFEEYCGACLVRAAERLRAAYPLDRPEGGWTTRGGVLLKSPAAGLKRILENERHGRPWRTEVRAAASGERPPPPIAPREERDDPWLTNLPLQVPKPAAAQLWDRVLRQLAGVLADGEIELWLRPLRLLSVKGAALWLQAPNYYTSQWFADHYQERVLALVAAELGQPVTLQWGRAEEPPAESAAAAGGGP